MHVYREELILSRVIFHLRILLVFGETWLF